MNDSEPVTKDLNPLLASAPTSGSASTRVPKALAWTIALRILTRTLAVATTFVVARLVAPEEYGIFAAVLIGSQMIGSLTDISMSSAIVQMERDPRPYLNTAWTVDVLRGLGVYALIFAVAPWWASILHVPEATELLRVLGISQVIVGLHNTGTYLLRRELDFRHFFVLHGGEAASYTLFVVVGGLVLHNSWALVLAVVMSYATRVALGYVVTPIRPRFGFERAKFREMFTFTKWTNAYGVIDFLLETADNAIVGSFVGTTALAFYRMAYQIATEGSSAVVIVVTPVAFPAFSRVQTDAARVRRGLVAMLGLASTGLVPLTALLIVLGPIAVPLLLGDRWSPTAAPLTILAAAALVRGFLEVARPVLLGVGRSREDFVLKLFQVVVLLVLLVPAATAYGIVGVAWAVLIAALAAVPLGVLLLAKSSGAHARDFLVPLAAPTASGLGALVAVRILPMHTSLPSLLFAAAVYFGMYCLLTAILLRLTPHSGIGIARAVVR